MEVESSEEQTAAGTAATPRRSAAAAAASSSSFSTLPVACRSLEQPRRSSRHACFLALLAPVELQSVMHFINVPSLLAFAQCSRRIYRNADSDFAWKHQPPFRVEFGPAQLQSQLAERTAGSLLRHLPATAVDWTQPKGGEL